MLVEEKMLMEWTGYKKRGALMRWLDKEAIQYRIGNKGHVITTLNAIEGTLNKDSEDAKRPTFL